MNDISQDNYTFTTAEVYYANSKSFNTPTSVTYKSTDNDPGQASLKTGAIFRFNDDTLLLLQFVRPTLWKIRYQPSIKNPSEYNDYNSRTIVQDTLTDLRDTLDEFEKIWWSTSVEESEDEKYYCFQSTSYASQADLEEKRLGTPVVRLFVEKSPFRIIAVRWLPATNDPQDAVPLLSMTEQQTKIETPAIIWQTAANGISWQKRGNTNTIVLSVVKPGAARYIGFGEQGGMSLFKYSTYMNYFDYDNMLYSGVYGKGAGDVREPLYHSEPFWIEVDTHQNLTSKVATFIDNYSQISIDFGKTNNGVIRTGIKYGSLQYYVMAGNDIPDIIRLYTSLVGRTRLKPRYVLGHHQGCYGYDTQQKVIDKVDQYRARSIPLDGVAIDVDIQDRYRTFTINLERFPDPKKMFRDLRLMGVKACTNITPVVSCIGEGYKTLEEGLKNGYFVKDERYTEDGIGKYSWDARYMCYEGGTRKVINPQGAWAGYPDDYDFGKVYNSGQEYHGGVCYGENLGTPGYYPDLNREEVRDWWGTQYQYLFDMGLEFVWQDMTSPCVAPAYGDMKGFPLRLMTSTDLYPNQAGKYPAKKPAIEMWSLFSYNLHKATYRGLNNMPLRQGKRNFIIGRGSFAGMHRYAGLWTGDNGSTWDFLRISVAQVLASGLSGGVVTGADVGGFMPNGNEHWADPELIIRWYCAYSMLPWFRNHYHGKEGMKYFQEPFVYTDHYYNPTWTPVLEKDKRLYLSVEPICRYYVELRYTFLQLLYDAMFENQINGMPIARALILTDVNDDSLFKDTADFLYREYMVRNDLLVCPRLFSEKLRRKQKLYLPQPDSWYKLNLRPDHNEYPDRDALKIAPRIALDDKYAGGTMLEWEDDIRLNDPEHIPYVTPMFVREGAIIPQIELRQFIPDLEGRKANPITLHIYPGKENTYIMYLDDGVSRASSPDELPQYRARPREIDSDIVYIDEDEEAKGWYRSVEIKHTTTNADASSYKRTVSIRTTHDGYALADLKRDIGDEYTVILWHDPKVQISSVKAAANDSRARINTDGQLKATVVNIPIQAQNTTDGTIIVCKFATN